MWEMLTMMGVGAVGSIIDAVVSKKKKQEIERHNKRISTKQNILDAKADNARAKDTNITSSAIPAQVYDRKIRSLENEKK